MQKSSDDIIIFLIVVSALIICMILFIIMMLYWYRKRQVQFQINLEQIRLDHEKTLMTAQLEMQEQTFQNISREIHDNIGLSLTLAKLQLNTFDWNSKDMSSDKLNSSVKLLTKSITELSDISKGLNADIIIQQGLLWAVEEEIKRIQQAGLFTVDFILTGTPAYMEAQQELVIFRIVQEAFNNIIKHANAPRASLHLHYDDVKLHIIIVDEGIGFDAELSAKNRQAGLINMKTRAKMLGGIMKIKSQPGQGTSLNFIIPFEQQ